VQEPRSRGRGCQQAGGAADDTGEPIPTWVIRGRATIGGVKSTEIISLRHEGLGNSSYIVGIAEGQALVVDPDRRVHRYLDAATTRGWDIVSVLDTHVHADFVTGSLELRERTGATLHLPKVAGVGFPHRALTPGERLELGDVEFEVIAAPGHAPEHVAYVMRGAPTETPHLFSGGALIAGGAARTDLIAPELTEPLTRAQFHTLHEAFADLPDATTLLPTHGSGSFCVAGGAGALATTLGAERATNPLVAEDDEEAFVTWWPATFPGIPTYFERMRAVNVSGPRPLGDIPLPPALAPDAFESARASGALVIDVRDPMAYATSHVIGSLSIHLRDVFATWLGWLVPADTPLLFVAGGESMGRIVDEASLVGYERFAGVLDGGIAAWASAGLPLASIQVLNPEEARRALLDGALPLDVREPDEVEDGAIAGAICIPLGSLEDEIGDLPPGRPVLTYCGAGERSTSAASILERHGIGPVVNLAGGYGVWRAAGRD
jgi:hydroxyacylglutathione hydrolase